MTRPIFVWLVWFGLSWVGDVPGAEPPVESFSVHPRVFGLVTCLASDTEEPVVTEINLDAVGKNRNQFAPDEVKRRGEWTECPGDEGQGFERYRVLKSEKGLVTVEYQRNGGGTYTSATIIEFVVESRELRQNGKPITRRVLRVMSCSAK
jgi:hypothetical protein